MVTIHPYHLRRSARLLPPNGAVFHDSLRAGHMDSRLEQLEVAQRHDSMFCGGEGNMAPGTSPTRKSKSFNRNLEGYSGVKKWNAIGGRNAATETKWLGVIRDTEEFRQQLLEVTAAASPRPSAVRSSQSEPPPGHDPTQPSTVKLPQSTSDGPYEVEDVIGSQVQDDLWEYEVLWATGEKTWEPPRYVLEGSLAWVQRKKNQTLFRILASYIHPEHLSVIVHIFPGFSVGPVTLPSR